MNKIKNFDAIIYHGPCSDGTGGLWCACYYSEIKTRYACKAGENPKGDYTGMNVIFVDICPKIEYLLELVKVAKFVVILDHHKSSEQMIKDNSIQLSSISNLNIIFDMKRSGCQMSWDYFFDNKPRPFFIDYMGDRDLWTWKLPFSKEINTALLELGYISSYDLTRMTELLEDSQSKIENLKYMGTFYECANKRQIDICIATSIETQIIIEKKTYRVWLGGNINPNLRSDLGNALCNKAFKDGSYPDFSACWQFDPKLNQWWISFRGVDGRSPDLSVLASKFGGGGHQLASSITIENSSKGLKKIFIY